MDFGIALSALSIIRYITDQVTEVSLSVMSRILFFHEMACSCVYLIERAPWMKRKGNKKELLRFENGVWKYVSIEDLPRLCKIEAQVRSDKSGLQHFLTRKTGLVDPLQYPLGARVSKKI